MDGRHIRAGVGGEEAEDQVLPTSGTTFVPSHSRQMPAKNISGRVSSRANHVQIDFEPWFLSGSPKLIAGMRHRYSG
jgi:hypothetical protein